MNYGFYISGQSARLYKFLNTTNRKNIELVKVVVSDKKIPIHLSKLLDDLSIKYFEVDHKALGINNQERNLKFSDILLEHLDKYKVDYMISLGEHLLTGDLLIKYQWHLINFHPALLPMYPGQAAIDQAVAHGNTLLAGNTAHFIDAGTDTGPVIMQSVIPLDAFYNSGNNYDSIMDLIVPMLEKLIELLEAQRIAVKDGRVCIIGADYERSSLFPYIGEWEVREKKDGEAE